MNSAATAALTAKHIMLILGIIMPPDKPDVMHRKPMASLEECWQAAQEFVARSIPDAARAGGAIGMGATCVWVEEPSVEN